MRTHPDWDCRLTRRGATPGTYVPAYRSSRAAGGLKALEMAPALPWILMTLRQPDLAMPFSGTRLKLHQMPSRDLPVAALPTCL